jgi:hypothetical protein
LLADRDRPSSVGRIGLASRCRVDRLLLGHRRGAGRLPACAQPSRSGRQRGFRFASSMWPAREAGRSHPVDRPPQSQDAPRRGAPTATGGS